MAKNKQSSLTSSPPERPAGDQAPVQATTLIAQSGPLPDPRTLEYYERVCPGSAQEIVNMAKAEQQHRHRGDFLNWAAVVFGQILAFILGMTGLCGGIELLYSGKSITGLSVFVMSLGALIAAAVWRQNQKPDSSSSQGQNQN